MRKIEQEAIKTDSNVSSMRIAFFWTIKIILILSILFAISYIVFSYLGKSFSLSSPAILIGALGGVAFGGKAVQSFSEPNPPQSIISTITQKIFPSKPMNTESSDPRGDPNMDMYHSIEH